MGAGALGAILLAVALVAALLDGDDERDAVATGPTTTSTSTTSTAPPTLGTDGAPGVGDPYFPGLGNGGFDVDHYALALTWHADQGVLELNLVAQDLTAWGHDLPGKPKLHELLKELAQVDVHWLRLHYAYPRVFPDELIELMATEKKIARYLDMPLQHASDRLLRSMKRGRESAFLKQLVQKIRGRVEGLTFRTSMIVGLPGETEEDFEILKSFVKELRFERLGVFQYSDEEGTGAFEMENKVPKKTIERRWRELMAIQKRISREQNKAMVGKQLEVLVEGRSPETDLLIVGRHAGQAPDIDGNVYINDGMAYPGELVTVEVTEAHDYDLVGRVVGRSKTQRHRPREEMPTHVRGGEKIVQPPTWLAPR